ncbi:MAG: hypothetical protein H7263_12900 [Candidatus Sericytochromatia bacterium]|nr:hypothetical protein [Candidatus Sericytochromatia bacterium]
MNFKKNVLSVVCSISVLSCLGVSYAVTNLSEKDRVTIYENIFVKDFNTQFFNEKPNMLEINGNKIGLYRANMKLLMEDVSLINAFKSFSKNNEYIDSEDILAKYSGIPALQKGKDKDELFRYYNPDFIKWGIENFYISPKTEIYGVKAQEIYDKSFQRFFRLTAQSYIFLNKKQGFYKKEQKRYMDAYNAGRRAKDPVYFFAPSYLYDNYDKPLKEYSQEALTYDPGTAVGFWLRRGLDKTDKVVWSGINKVMKNYDNEWFKKVSK